MGTPIFEEKEEISLSTTFQVFRVSPNSILVFCALLSLKRNFPRCQSAVSRQTQYREGRLSLREDMISADINYSQDCSETRQRLY
jgi:hypothetical protein